MNLNSPVLLLRLMVHERILFSTITNIAHCWTLSLYHIRGHKKYWLLSLPDDKATQYIVGSTVCGNFCSRKFIFSILRCGCLIRRKFKMYNHLHIHCKTERENIKRRCCNRHIGVSHNKGEALHQKPWTFTLNPLKP